MLVGNRMTKEPITVKPEDLLIRAAHKMQSGGFRRVPVVSEGKLCGIVTDRDIALRVTGARRDPNQTNVEEIMTPDPIRISVDKDLHHLTALMHAYQVRRVPIVNSFDTALGIVTLDDLIAQLGEEMSEIGKAIAEEVLRGNG